MTFSSMILAVSFGSATVLFVRARMELPQQLLVVMVQANPGQERYFYISANKTQSWEADLEG